MFGGRVVFLLILKGMLIGHRTWGGGSGWGPSGKAGNFERTGPGARQLAESLTGFRHLPEARHGARQTLGNSTRCSPTLTESTRCLAARKRFYTLLGDSQRFDTVFGNSQILDTVPSSSQIFETVLFRTNRGTNGPEARSSVFELSF